MVIEREAAVDHESNQQRPHIIILVGGEGLGKTTQAELLAESLGLPFYSTGNTLRAIRDDYSDQSDIAQKVRQMFRDATYLDKDILHLIMTQRLTQPDMSSGFVVDGMLRTMGETIEFPDFLQSIGKGNAIVDVIRLRGPVWLGVQRTIHRNRDDKDSMEATRNRQRNFYKDVRPRLRLARKIIEESGGRYLVVYAKADGERPGFNPSDREIELFKQEIQKRIVGSLENG